MKATSHFSWTCLLLNCFLAAVAWPQARVPKFTFVPATSKPILQPQGDTWEARAVYHPAAAVKDTTIYLFYRAEDRAGDGIWNGTSRIGLATSNDGVQFVRHAEPVISPTLDYETPGGCEDPHVVQIDSIYYMIYTAYDAHTARLALASSTDLLNWKKLGLIFPDSLGIKSAAMLPRKMNDRYTMYFSDGEIKMAYSDNLLHWTPQPESLLRTRAGMFDSQALVLGPAPLVLDSTIVLFYNGINERGESTIGYATFSLFSHSRVLARSEAPLLEPLPPDEHLPGHQNMSFAGGVIPFKEKYLLFLGVDNSELGVATGKLIYVKKL